MAGDYGYIKDNLEHIRERVSQCAARTGRTLEDITLVAVTKTIDPARIQAAVDFGICNLGENRAQEYLEKRDAIQGKIFWHFIGQMQSNKVKYIIGGISLLQSLDRPALAREINLQCEKNGIELNTLIEINIAREESKAGIDINELDSLIEQLAAYPHIRVKGLMTVAPFTQDKGLVRQCFEKMHRQYERLKAFESENLQMQVLSMGMSADYEEAVLEGSNMLRIGTGLFGSRPKK